MKDYSTCNPEQLYNELFVACRDNDLEAVRYLLTSPQLSVHADIHLGNTALRTACMEGHMDIVRYLLTSPELVERANVHGENEIALRYACAYGQIEVMRYLFTSPDLDTHCDPQVNDAMVLGLAMSNKDYDTLHFLLYEMNIQACPEQCDVEGRPDKTQELRYLVQKRDTFVQLQHLNVHPHEMGSPTRQKI